MMRCSIIAVAALCGSATAYTDVVHKRFMLKNIDPIVLPGTYRSHMHSFFGSDAVTKDLPTTEELQRGCPSGENANDLSAYWIPTMYYVDGGNYTEVDPVMFSTYYENIDKAEIPFPPNYHAVAGNASARSQDDIDEHINVILRFPDCVDTDDLRQNAYAAAHGGRCLSPMKRIPQLRFSVRYPAQAVPGGWRGPPPLKLACAPNVGEGFCFHGDFINGWFDDAAKNMLNAKSSRQFLRIDGDHRSGKTRATCRPRDADPGNGTSDYLTSLKMMKMA